MVWNDHNCAEVVVVLALKTHQLTVPISAGGPHVECVSLAEVSLMVLEGPLSHMPKCHFFEKICTPVLLKL